MSGFIPANRPTLHFIGVTTASSSIMQVFPAWAAHLGLHDAAIAGMDFPLHADPGRYRDAVAFIQSDPLSRGALVTTHKLDLYAACHGQFGSIDPLARLMGEVSCLSKPGGGLHASAKDPITAGLALDGFLPPGHFAASGADMLVLGAGGSAIAMTWHMARPERGADRPRRIVVTDPDAGRLQALAEVHRAVGHGVAVRTHGVAEGVNEACLHELPEGSLVVNATGLGKDRPGSPLSADAVFPRRGIVWDLNYRGALDFLAQARQQRTARALQVEDGWTYFIHGWSQVIAEVFGIAIDGRGPVVAALSDLASTLRPQPVS